LLALLRKRSPEKTWVEHVRVTMREPRTRKVFEARGALAVDPHRAMRMILVGPAGATALDVWVTPKQWRIHVPVLGAPRRGEAAPPELPVDFFRFWFLSPFAGRLLTVEGSKLVLRDKDATVVLDVEARPGHTCRIRAERRSGTREQTLEWTGLLAHPASGDHARWTDASGSSVEVVVEGVSFELEDAAAFIDPDEAKGVSL
jgi:hypothetical protein